MQTLKEMSTTKDVDDFIKEICRHMPDPQGFRRKAETSDYTAAERAKDAKLDALCNALARLAEISAQNSSDCAQQCGPNFSAHR